MLSTLSLTVALLAGPLSAHPCLPFERDARADAPAAPAPLPPPAIIHRVPAPLAASEQARYRLTYGVLPVGEATVDVDGDETVRDQGTLHARGHAEGSFVGFGGFDKTMDVGFDPIALVPRPRGHTLRWFRRLPPALLPGAAPTFDPVSLLLRLRAAPPAPGTPLTATVSDGNGRWQVTLTDSGTTTVGTDQPALKFAGRAAPMGGGASDKRVAHDFTIWLAADENHLPLRLVMPLGVADLTVSLVEVHRTAAPRAAR
jgi:hypothetical protein